MLELDAVPQLVYRLRQFNESVPEEAEATQKLLSVFENLIEVKPDVAEQLVQLGDNKTGFLRCALLCMRQVHVHVQADSKTVSTMLTPSCQAASFLQTAGITNSAV